MFDFLFKTPAWQLVIQSDAMTKLVLSTLFFLSVFCVWIVICKFLSFRKERQAAKRLQMRIKKARSFDDLLAVSKEFKEYAVGRFLVKGLGELKELVQAKKGVAPGQRETLIAPDARLSEQEFEYFQVLLDQSLEAVLAEEEEYLPVLGTSAAVSPLVGLFGTVWGLVHAFIDISRHKSADISVVAPGIAEALTTTIAGLVVAIPALIFFHYFSNELRNLEQQLFRASDKFLNIIRRTFV